MEILEKVIFPKMYAIRRKPVARASIDVAAETRKTIEASGMLNRLPQGTEVAITAGSRGVGGLVAILRTIGDMVRQRGCVPFVVTAMGSHGGATPAGQRRVIEELGVTTEAIGMEIRSALEAVEIARTMSGAAVYINREAMNAGGIIVVNRVKPHSSIAGPHQSGIVKMLAVGLGGRQGADEFHRHGPGEMAELLPMMAEEILARARVMGGVGIVEDGDGRPFKIRAVTPDDFIRADTEMLVEAEALTPRLPFDRLDVLVVDEIGKDKSGVGMDANVIGRRGIRGVPDLPKPLITRIVALSLSEKSLGNAHGVGLADFVTERLAAKIDRKATLTNAMTSRFPEKAALPPAFATDREAVAAALFTCHVHDTSAARLVKIKSTSAIDAMMVSETLLDETKRNGDWEIVGGPSDMFGS